MDCSADNSTNTNSITMEDLITIEEILTEASAYGVRNEVRELAAAFRSLSFTDVVNNYQEAFNNIVNNV